MLFPGETKIIKTLAVGSAIEANQPITSSTFFTEGNSDDDGRTSVRVYHCLNYIGQGNNHIPIAVKNKSSINKTVGKGSKIGQCYRDFIKFKVYDVDKINILDCANFSVGPIGIMCKQENYKHFSDEDFLEVWKSLLIDFIIVNFISIPILFIRFLLPYAEYPFTRNSRSLEHYEKY